MLPTFLSQGKPLGSGPAPSEMAFKANAPVLVLPERATPPRVLIVHGAWHPHFVGTYCTRVKEALAALDPRVQVSTHASVGVGEIPLTVRRLLTAARAKGEAVDGVICLGVMIKGDTLHMEMVAMTASSTLGRLQDKFNLPVLNGIVAAYKPEDAADR